MSGAVIMVRLHWCADTPRWEARWQTAT